MGTLPSAEHAVPRRGRKPSQQGHAVASVLRLRGTWGGSRFQALQTELP